MSTPFCKRCGCVADDDIGYCDECEPIIVELQGGQMDCAYPCNGACRSCGQPVVYVTMLPIEYWSESVAMNPELEHGGNIEIRPNNVGKLFAKETGPDPELKKFIMHSTACIKRRPYSKADALMPTDKNKNTGQGKTWPEERASMIQKAIEGLSK